MTRALVMSDYADPDTEIERLRGVVERAEGVVASVSELGDSYREMPGSKFVSAKSVQRLVAALAKLEAKHG